MDHRLIEHRRLVTDDTAFEHLAMVGSQDDPGVVKDARALELIEEPAEFSVGIQDELIVVCAPFAHSFLIVILIEEVEWFGCGYPSVLSEATEEFSMGLVGRMRWHEMQVTHEWIGEPVHPGPEPVHRVLQHVVTVGEHSWQAERELLLQGCDLPVLQAFERVQHG